MARTQLGLGHLTTSLPFERKTVGLLQAAPHYGEAKNSLVTPTIAIDAPQRTGALFAQWRRLGFLPDGTDPDPDFTERREHRELTDLEVTQFSEVFVGYRERVTMSPRERRGRAFEPSRVKIMWR